MIVDTSGWNEFPPEDKGSWAAPPPRPEETWSSIWPGCLLKASQRGGGGASGKSIREETPGQTLDRLERLYLWSGNAWGRRRTPLQKLRPPPPPVTQTGMDEECDLKNGLIFYQIYSDGLTQTHKCFIVISRGGHGCATSHFFFCFLCG